MVCMYVHGVHVVHVVHGVHFSHNHNLNSQIQVHGPCMFAFANNSVKS